MTIEGEFDPRSVATHGKRALGDDQTEKSR